MWPLIQTKQGFRCSLAKRVLCLWSRRHISLNKTFGAIPPGLSPPNMKLKLSDVDLFLPHDSVARLGCSSHMKVLRTSGVWANSTWWHSKWTMHLLWLAMHGCWKEKWTKADWAETIQGLGKKMHVFFLRNLEGIFAILVKGLQWFSVSLLNSQLFTAKNANILSSSFTYLLLA